MLYSATFVNQTRNCQFGDQEPEDLGTDKIGEAFRILSKEYGRCVSKMYRDREGKPPICLGWVFEKRMKYEDARTNKPDDFYIRETWVTLHDKAPETKTEFFYHEMEA